LTFLIEQFCFDEFYLTKIALLFIVN